MLDDLLNLNPIRIAAADGAVGAAAASVAAEAPATDARLQQKVSVHATSRRLGDLLAWLSRTTGVQMIARMEVAEEPVSLWAEDRTLMDVMRDLRHLHGYYWSRYRRDGQYLYALWQDAQSRAQEEADLQRLAMKLHREFVENIQRHVRALDAPEADLKRIGRDDPYFVVQMTHLVVRNGYRLFAALSPDQQAQLTQGQTPSRGVDAGHMLALMSASASAALRGGKEDQQPLGDVVTLRPSEMTPAQRKAVAAILDGAAQQLEKEGRVRQRQNPERFALGPPPHFREAQLLAAADRQTAAVTFFRWGDPNWQGLSLRIDFQSGGGEYGLYSNIAVPNQAQQSYSDSLRKGDFQVIPGAQQEVDRFLGRDYKQQAQAVPPRAVGPARGHPPDPILDAPVSLEWSLRPAGWLGYVLSGGEIVGALHRDLRRPLILDGYPKSLQEPRQGTPFFRVARRPLREVLGRLFPGQEVHTSMGAIFIRDPVRLKSRLNALPSAVRTFLERHPGPYTLEDLALLSRSLSPWQIVKLGEFLPETAIDPMLAARELLALYGELAPAQRNNLPTGVPFSALTPPQQALFLAFAQRHRPFVEPWRFQNSALRMGSTPIAAEGPPRPDESRPAARVLFQVTFLEGDTQSFPVDLFPKPARNYWNTPVTDAVGKPFPFPSAGKPPIPIGDGLTWKPALADERLRKKALVLVLSQPYVEPYAGTRRAPTPLAWSEALAKRLAGTPFTVVHVALGAAGPLPAARPEALPPNLLHLPEPGGVNGDPFVSGGGGWYLGGDTVVFLVGNDEIVRRVFEQRDAWDADAIERAAREMLAAQGKTR